MNPLREAEYSELCGICSERASSFCPACEVPLCPEHTPENYYLCVRCEVEVSRVQVRSFGPSEAVMTTGCLGIFVAMVGFVVGFFSDAPIVGQIVTWSCIYVVASFGVAAMLPGRGSEQERLERAQNRKRNQLRRGRKHHRLEP